MIEIKTYPEKDHIYIDFAYQGIPENIPIDCFSCLRRLAQLHGLLAGATRIFKKLELD